MGHDAGDIGTLKPFLTPQTTVHSPARRFAAWAAGTVLALASLAAGAVELRGFRGVAWGAGVASLGDAEPASAEDGLRCFRRERENLLYGDVPLSEVRFCFRDDRLVMVVLDAQVDPRTLRAEFQNTYGPPRASSASSARWGDASTRARVEIVAPASGARASMRMVAN